MRLLDLVVRTEIAKAVGWTLVHVLWEGAIIAAVLAIFLLAARSPRIRYVAGSVALLAMLASFIVTLIHLLPERANAVGALMRITPPPQHPIADVSSTHGWPPEFNSLIPWLGPVWIAGVLIFYLRYAAGWLSLQRVRRRGMRGVPDSWQRSLARLALDLKVKRPVLLLESMLTDTPAVLGHFRPVVLVPLGFLAGLPPSHVEAILLHELAHIKRADYFMNVCQRLIEGLLFYHPAVWWISQVVRTERENCCDDMVVSLSGDVHGYALALTALEQNRLEQRWPSQEPAVAATGGNLMKRIKRLLYPKTPSGIWAPALAALLLMTSTTVVMAAWHANSSVSSSPEQAGSAMNDSWQKWLNEDVVYIITTQERSNFKGLKTEEERQQFVEQFWARRDPTPGTPENEYKNEHYRRIAFANKHWAGNLAGWKTDRGRIYILHGPPDEIDSHPAGGSYERPASEGGGTVMTYPFEDWRYAQFEGIGSLSIEFVDVASSGDFRMTLDPNAKYKKP